MLRIKDLPEGGGAEGGRQVWFKLVTEDGQTQTLALAGMGLALLLFRRRR